MLKQKNKFMMTTALAVSLIGFGSSVQAFEHESDWNVRAHATLPHSLNKEVESFLQKSAKAHVDVTEEVSQKHQTIAPGFAPLISENEDGTVSVSQSFQDSQDLLLEMNDLSYLMVKGDKASIPMQKKFQEAGYAIQSFGGLEGRRNTFGDLSGLIFVKQDTGKVYVIIHGTATVDGVEIDGVDHGKMAGWQTNFDGARQKAFKIQKEFGKDLFEHVLEDMKHGRIHIKNKAYKELKKALKSKLHFEETGYQDVQKVHTLFQEALDNEDISHKTGKKILDAFYTKIRVMDHIDREGVDIPGEFHNGFGKKYLSFREDLTYKLQTIGSKMDIEEMYVSGHSMGGGLAPLAAYDIKKNFGDRILGDNNRKGVVKGYFLSAARVGTKDFARAIDEEVGKENMVRHNVYGDPVPIAAGDKFMKELLEKIPAIGELLGQAAGYEDFGYLVKDDPNETWERAKEVYKGSQEFSQYVDMADELSEAISTAYGWTGKKEELPGFIAGKQKKITWYGNPIQWSQRAYRVGKLAKLVKASMDGDAHAQEKLMNTVMVRYAHLHFGYNRTQKTGAVFDPRVVGRDLNKMANAGKVHEDHRAAERKAKKSK